MVLKTISPGSGVWASLIFFCFANSLVRALQSNRMPCCRPGPVQDDGGIARGVSPNDKSLYR